MAKEVILMQDVDGLGAEGDVVKVADGYARNFLMPKSIAAPVTEATRRRLEKQRKEREARLADQRVEAEKQLSVVEQTSCTIAVKAGEGGQLFGSVNAADIAAALKDQGVNVDKKQVALEQPLRELGVFKVPIHLHPEIHATLKVWVVEE
jgi:large subunit ribosomal protein L9